jgi:hypothetical protein
MDDVARSAEQRDSLIGALLEFRLRQVLRLDLAFAMAGGAAAAYAAIDDPKTLHSAVGPTAQAFGVIVGLALASVAIQAAFMNQPFLRKVKAIGRDPVKFLTPMLFTVTVGVFGMVAIIVLSAISPAAPSAVLGTVAGLAGFFVAWTLGSLLYNMSTLISFVRLQADAADIPDDFETLPTQTNRQPGNGERRASG